MEYLTFQKSKKEDKETLGKIESRLLIPIIFFLSFLIIYCLGFTFSRGAWAGFWVGLVFLAFFYKRRFFVPILIGILFMVVFSPMMEKSRNVSFNSDNVTKEAALKPAKSNFGQKTIGTSVKQPAVRLNFEGMGRYTFWKEALHIIQEFPILGVGINTYSIIAPEYKLTWGGYPHNCYLQMAAETGAVGVLAFFWILFRLFRQAILAFLVKNDKFSRAVLSGLSAGLLAFLIHSAVDTNFYSVQLGVLMWVAMAVLMAFSRDEMAFAGMPLAPAVSPSFDFTFLKSIKAPFQSFLKRSPSSKARIILLIFVAFIILSYIDRSNANSKYAKVYYSLGEESLQKGHIDKARKYFKRAIELNPQSAKGYFGFGLAYKENKQDAAAIELFEKGIELDPNFHKALNALGLIYQGQGQYAKAIDYFEKALHSQENYNDLPEYRYNMGVTYVLMGDKASAQDQVKYIKNIDNPQIAQKLKEYIESH